MAEAKTFGYTSCPVCRSERARVSLSKAQLSVVTCNRCNCQLFCRSDLSDEIIRSKTRHTDDPAAPAAAAKSPVPDPQPEKPDPAPTPAADETAPAKFSFFL